MAEDDKADAPSGIEALQREAGRYATGCDWRAEEHRVDSRFWQRVAWILGGLAATATAAASLALFTGAEQGSTTAVVGGFIAGLAALFAALNTTVLSPQKMADEHHAANAAFASLRGDFFHLRNVVAPNLGFEQANTRFGDLKGRRDGLMTSYKEPSERAKAKVRKRREN